MGSLKFLEVLPVENVGECSHNHINLNIIQHICGKLVLVLEVSGIFQQDVWQ